MRTQNGKEEKRDGTFGRLWRECSCVIECRRPVEAEILPFCKEEMKNRVD